MSNIEEKVKGSVGQESEALSAEVETEVKADEVQRTKKLKKREDCLALLLKIVSLYLMGKSTKTSSMEW